MNEDVLMEIMIPLNPVTKKNNQEIAYKYQNGKKIPFIVPSKTFKQYQRDCGIFLRRPKKPINEPIEIECIFVRSTEIRCDLTNLLEAIDDVLVHYGIIADDNFKIIKSHDGSRVLVDKSMMGTYITIRRYNQDDSIRKE